MFQVTPTTPMPLLPTAPIVPAVCVPWPLSSIGSPECVTDVDTMDVVDVAIVVVVDAVAGNLAGVRPDVRRQIGMVVIDAGVDVGDDLILLLPIVNDAPDTLRLNPLQAPQRVS